MLGLVLVLNALLFCLGFCLKRGLLSGSLLGCCLTDKCLLPARFVICFGPASRLLTQALQLGLFRLVLLLLRQRFTQGS